MRNLSTIHNMCLAYGFQSVDALCVPLADLHNLAKAAFANNGGQFKIIDGEWMTLNAKSLQGSQDEKSYARCSAGRRRQREFCHYHR
jgi:hypothetical protein